MTTETGAVTAPPPHRGVLERGRGLGLTEVARTIGKSTKTVRRLILADELPAFRIGGQLTIFEADLEAFIDARRIAGGDAA